MRIHVPRIHGGLRGKNLKLVRAIKYYKIKSFTSFKKGESYIDTRLFDKRLFRTFHHNDSNTLGVLC